MNRYPLVCLLVTWCIGSVATVSYGCGYFPVAVISPANPEEDPLLVVVGEYCFFADGGSFNPLGGEIVEWCWYDGSTDDYYHSYSPSWCFNFSSTGEYEIRLYVKNDVGVWSDGWIENTNPPVFLNPDGYASCYIEVWDPEAPLGSKSVQFTTNTDGVSAPAGTWDNPAIGGGTKITNVDAECVVVYNPTTCGWEWQVEALCDVFCGIRPGIVDISSGDDSDLTEDNYCSIVNAMLNYAGVVNKNGTYYGCHEYIQGHEDVHLQQIITELNVEAARMLNDSIMGPYPVDFDDPNLASAEAFFDEYESDVWNEALNRCMAANSTVVNSQDYEDAAVEAMEPYNTALGQAICAAAANKQPPWPYCEYCEDE